MLDNKGQNQNWLTTLPGIIASIATLVSAIGGLIVILSSNGFFKEQNQTNSEPKSSFQPNTNPKQIVPTVTVGRFPQASDRLLTSNDIDTLSTADLKIMRNEIFARRGYIFKQTDMKTYFRYQNWYSPRFDDVNSLLTEIEKRNLKLIKSYE